MKKLLILCIIFNSTLASANLSQICFQVSVAELFNLIFPVKDKNFVSTILKNTEDFWSSELRRHDIDYVPPKIVLVEGKVDLGAGIVRDSVKGPFYDPFTNTIYLNPDFKIEGSNFSGSELEFDLALMIAHEVSHHIQKSVGITLIHNYLTDLFADNEETSNRIRVASELNADYLAGMWVKNLLQEHGVLEQKDFDNAMKLLNDIGDDSIQKATGQELDPTLHKHGTAEERQQYFLEGTKSDSVQDAVDSYKKFLIEQGIDLKNIENVQEP